VRSNKDIEVLKLMNIFMGICVIGLIYVLFL